MQMDQFGQFLYIHRLLQMFFNITQNAGQLALVTGVRYLIEKIGIPAAFQAEGKQLKQAGLPAQGREEGLFLERSY
ncbi:hypothetical protein D3C73_1339620 [compost metagenome]